MTTTVQVPAIYRDGRVELLEPLPIKRNNVRLIVTVPAEELADTGSEEAIDLSAYHLSPEAIAAANQMQARIDAILNAPLPPDDEIPALTEKQQDRIAAFELRAQLRCEQGRPL